MKKQQRKRSGQSVQELIGIKTFTRYGVMTDRGEYVFYHVTPTNISVLSKANVEMKIRHLTLILSALFDIEIMCTDACDKFDNNDMYLRGRLEQERNTKVREVIQKDINFLENIQSETASSRQFMFVIRFKSLTPEQIFQESNNIEKTISDQGFEVKRMKKEDIKRMLALYFGAGTNGEYLPDVDGEQYKSVNVGG